MNLIWSARESDSPVHRPHRPARSAGPAAGADTEPPLVLACPDRRPVRVDGPGRLGGLERRSGRDVQRAAAGPDRGPGRRSGLPRPAARGRAGPARLYVGSALVRRGRAGGYGPGGGGLLFPGVRHHRGAAAVLRRPGHPGRGSPEVGQRPRRAADRGRPAVPARVLHPVAVRRRLAGRALPGRRPERPVARAPARRRGPARPRRGQPDRRPPAGRPGLGGAGGPDPAAAARLLRGGERAGPARGHRPAVRRRQRAPAPAGTAARHRRDARGAGLLRADRAPLARGVPHQRGARRLPRPGADPRVRRARAELRRGHRGLPGGHGVHHAHAGSGRHRPVPPPAGPAAIPRRPAAARRPGARARRGDLPGRRPRCVQHGRHGHAAGPAGQRRLAPARPGEQEDVRGPVAGIRHPRGADRLDHQRRAHAHLGRARGRIAGRRARRLGLGPGRSRPGRRDLGRPARAAVPAGGRDPAAAARLLAAARRVRGGADLDRRRARRACAHHRVRPAGAVLQAAHAHAERPGPAQHAC